MSHTPTDLVAGLILVATAAVVFWRVTVRLFVIIAVALLMYGALQVFRSVGLEIHRVDGGAVSSEGGIAGGDGLDR